MDESGTKEKLEAVDASGNMDGAGIHGADFARRPVDDQSSHRDSPQPPSSNHGTDAGSMDDPDYKTNLERDRQGLPRLNRKETRLAQKESNPWEHLGITLGLPMVLLFDIIVPCIIYYIWYHNHRSSWELQCTEEFPGQPLSSCPTEAPQFDKDILGSAIASFGIGELWILLGRVHRLFVHHEDCAPLISRSRWELDATSWVYAVAMVVALVPFVVGSALVMPKLYLYGPSFLMGFLGVLMVMSVLYPFPIPVRLSSQPRGSPMRPFIYYAAEDFLAVDGLQDREFRVRYNDRYESNPLFRRFLFNLTLWWALGVCVYIGCVSAVIWTVEFHYAFGLSLGVLFSYIAIWAVVTYIWIGMEMQREHEAYERGDFEA
ncbi:hypothetical protein VM1G_11079 [Cytospora mali]|uniref:Uncharacterized protein n=1 Tax=Cytospora mali TaxID=578113 RepID=A0A194VJF5_CYTMA|nr:hypothetical protein VM1G_11079 [Valsa mali]